MGQDYVFACARVRANEKNLLSREKLNRMIEAKSMEDACKVLQEAAYGDEGETVRPAEYEKTLAKETEKLYAFLNSLAPNAAEFKIFSYPIDYRNIKLLLKAEAVGRDVKELLLGGGSIAAAELERTVHERDFSFLTSRMKRACEEAIDSLARTRDPQSVDLICDRHCYAELSELAEKTKNKYLINYVRLLTDTVNLKTFVRCRRMGQSWSYFESVYLEGGSISAKTFVAGYDEPIQQFASRLAATALARAAEEGGNEFKESGRFTSLEKLCDDAIMAYVRNAKYIAFGIEPLIGYAVGKQTEIKNVRIILSGKAAGIGEEQLRERMREVYG